MVRKKKKFSKKMLQEVVIGINERGNLKKSEKISKTIIISLISLAVTIVGTIIVFWFNYKNYSRQYDEDIRINIHKYFEDYTTNIVEGYNKAYITINFHCKLINNSEKPILLEQFESTSFDGFRLGYGLYNIETNEMVKFPIRIDSKESKIFIIQEIMIMDTEAYLFVKTQLKDLKAISMKTVEQTLLIRGIDIFGCKQNLIGKNGREMVGYNSDSLYEKESFIGKFVTTNGDFKSKYSYYLDSNAEWD